MIFVIMLIFFVLIFPFFVEITIYYNKDIKKLFFSLYMFKAIKIISGYATFKDACIFIHVKNKAFIIPPYALINSRNKFNSRKIIHHRHQCTKPDFPIFLLWNKSNQLAMYMSHPIFCFSVVWPLLKFSMSSHIGWAFPWKNSLHSFSWSTGKHVESDILASNESMGL